MNEKFRAAGLSTRLITAVILAAVLIAAWVMGGFYVAGLVALLAVAGLGEFLFLFQRSGGWGMKVLGLLLGAGYIAVGTLFPQYPPQVALGVCALLTALYALFCWSREKRSIPCAVPPSSCAASCTFPFCWFPRSTSIAGNSSLSCWCPLLPIWRPISRG